MNGTRRLSRRGFLAVTGGMTVAAAGGGTLAATASGGREVSGGRLAGRAELPRPFTVPLPVPTVARPVRTTGGVDRYEVTQRVADVEILPGLRTPVWGYDGLFPGPTFVGRSGRKVLVTVRNELPVPTSTHLHGGVTPPDSDGYPTDIVIPEGWRHDPHGQGGPGGPGGPDGHGGQDSQGGHGGMKMSPDAWTISRQTKRYDYPLDQEAATLWYHDHRMDFSAPQVWRGLAGFFLVRDAVEENLPLPSGDRDIPLMICDRAFEEDGSFRYPALDPSLTGRPGVEDAYTQGVMGDVTLVNGAPWPELEVDAVRYRLRLLNASNARRYRLRLEPGAPMTQVAGDCGLLPRPQRLDTVTLAPAERAEMVIDFKQWKPGDTVTLVNTLEDGAMRNVLRFRVARRAKDPSHLPTRLRDLRPLSASDAVATRRFDFRMTATDGGHAWTINGHPFDTERYLASPRLGTVERWRFTSDFHHPVHLHLAHFQVEARNGRPPAAHEGGWKDTVDVRPYETVDVLARFHGYRGRYMLHCHNLEHEDMAMMANFRVV
ncbi:multicopper oxidase family protein [Streptomyces paludis]|uniref:Multicopper oxidase CueO n=1 Tax=Streptomyces paludis TaxID=2282738 RepID=A0A345HQ81_9ACTN|nr:multicopper oxidase family protein [Streptomyces paludis]AXG78855.1 multicopper oxidase family protein [Streptomyces paludis]